MTRSSPPHPQQRIGCFGTIDRLEIIAAGDAATAWSITFAAIAQATGASPEVAHDFLDSRHGRHFAEDVANGLARGRTLEDAIDVALTRCMGAMIVSVNRCSRRPSSCQTHRRRHRRGR